MLLGSGGTVISNLPQRTDWTLEWNAQMAVRADNSGVEYGLAPLAALNRSEQVSFLVAEQNAALAVEYADHAYVIENGRVEVSGPAAELPL